mgnify:CR=1 FL=1
MPLRPEENDGRGRLPLHLQDTSVDKPVTTMAIPKITSAELNNFLSNAALRHALGNAAFRNALGNAAFRDAMANSAFRNALANAAFRDALDPRLRKAG